MTLNFEDISLLPSQSNHATKLKHILSVYPLALDLSMLGAGKTFTASHIALDPDFHFSRVVVIAPVSVQPKWNEMKQKYGVPVTNNISFSQLRSVKCKQPSHHLLMRKDYTVNMQMYGNTIRVDKVEFTPTLLMQQYVREGVLLIIDEIQNVKNITSQFLACRSMVKAIVGQGEMANASRVLILSGSPIDRREQVVALFRTMNVMKSDDLALYNVGRRVLEWKGMEEIERACRDIDDETVEHIHTRFTHRGYMSPGCLDSYCYELFQQIFKHERSSAMQVPRLAHGITKLNAFFEVKCPRERAALICGVTALSKACSFNAETGKLDTSGIVRGAAAALDSIQQVTRALLQIETGKIGTLVDAARTILTRDPMSKVVLCVNYKATIKDLVNGLRSYSPLVLDGSVTVRQREDILRKFQSPSSDFRVIIGNVNVMSTGIDLDDQDGRFPRTALVNPNYNTISLYQLGHRFLRANTRSSACVIFCFAKHSTELHVLQALSKKSTVMKQTTTEQCNAGVVFPGEYERVDGDVLLSKDKWVLIDVPQVAFDDEEGPPKLGTQTLEAVVTNSNECDPFRLEVKNLKLVLTAKQEALKISSCGDVHI